MNKAQLINQVANRTKMTKTAVLGITNALIETIEKTLKKGEKVKLVGFGSWNKRRRKERMGRNPQTGAAIKIQAKNTVTFHAGEDLLDLIN